MLHSVRSTVLPMFDAAIETHALVAARFRIHAVNLRGMISEDLLHLRAFPRLGQIRRPVATVVLDGRALLRLNGERTWVEAGQAFTLASKTDFSMRQEPGPKGGSYRSFMVEWDSALGSVRSAVVKAGNVQNIERVWALLRSSALSKTSTLAQSVFAVRNFGLNVPELKTEPATRCDARSQKLCSAIDRALSNLTLDPKQVDLEASTGLSARQLRRSIELLHETYGYNAASWIDARNRRRLMVASTLMTRDDVRVAEVAALVGYKSPQVMARAFVLAGYPPPSSVRALVHVMQQS
jgi:AraC-like DNA-binding protein